MARHSVISSTPPPGAWTLFNDGVPSIRLGGSFYVHSGYKADFPDARCVGGRLWCPNDAALPQTVTLFSGRGLFVDHLPGFNPPTIMQSKTVPTVPGGWAEAIWDEPIPLLSDGEPVFVMYEFPGGDARKYVYTNDFKQDNGLFRPADDGSRLAMSGFRDTSTSGRELYGMAFASPDTAEMISAVRGSVSYGVDVIIDEGPEPSGPGISWTDGTTESAASLLGWWDGSDIQPAVLKGWWDGTTIQDLT